MKALWQGWWTVLLSSGCCRSFLELTNVLAWLRLRPSAARAGVHATEEDAEFP